MFTKSRAEKNVEPSSRKTADNKVERQCGEAQLQRAIGNLIANAVHHSHPKSEIQATISSGKDAVAVHISNRGPGIPAEHLERVFDRFYRMDNARSRTDTGSGLGLAIVKSIMELHGGHVTVASKTGELTTFTLHFPKNNI